MQISFSLPDNQFVTESPEEVTRKIRIFAALGLYQAGEVSVGAASELVGLDRYEFLEFCKREGVVYANARGIGKGSKEICCTEIIYAYRCR